MLDHLFQSLPAAESRYPYSVLILADDFNRLDVRSITKHFRLKQIVKKPTRRNAAILDLALTNLHIYYDEPRLFPPFGVSDHNIVTAEPKVKDNSRCSTKILLKRDRLVSRRTVFGRYLSVVDWYIPFSSIENCEDTLNVFHAVLRTGLDLLMPIRSVRANTSDAPDPTFEITDSERQKAFHKNDPGSPPYKFYRNVVNRERKGYKANFYKSKVEHTKEENLKMWWKAVKRLRGAQSFLENVTSQMQVEGVENL